MLLYNILVNFILSGALFWLQNIIWQRFEKTGLIHEGKVSAKNVVLRHNMLVSFDYIIWHIVQVLFYLDLFHEQTK